MARNSKSYYELRQATSEYGLNKSQKLTVSKTMNFQTINHDELNDNKSTSGIDSSSSQDKENDLNDQAKNSISKEENKNKSNLNANLDSGRDSSSTLNGKESKEFKNAKDSKENCSEVANALRLMNAVRDECSILKKELIAKEKQLIIQEKQFSELQLKYDKRKARHREQMMKLK